jgi:hypothetical protein
VWVGDIQATEEADRNGGKSRLQKMGAYWTVEEAIGGGKVTGSGGKARSEADSAGKGSTTYIGGVGGVGQRGDQVTQLLEAAVVAARDVADSAGEGSRADIGGVGGVGQMEDQVTQFLEVAGVAAGVVAGVVAEDMSSLGNEEGGTDLAGNAIEKADRTGGNPGILNSGAYNTVGKELGGAGSEGLGGKAGGETDRAEEGKTGQIGDVEDGGQFVDQSLTFVQAGCSTQGAGYDSDDSSIVVYKPMSQEASNSAGLVDLREIVPYVQDMLKQSEYFIEGDLLEGVKKGECLKESVVLNLNKGGSTSNYMLGGEVEQSVNEEVLEIEPLDAFHADSKGKDSDWVLERVKSLCHVWGMSCEGYEVEMEKLFHKIEGNRGKMNSPVASPAKATPKGSRELRSLESTINYDGKQGHVVRGQQSKR